MAYTPSIFMVSWPDTEIHVLFTHSFNRCCGGWEAAIDWGGDQDGLPDGPARDASETEIVDWIEATVRRARNMVEKKSA